jgi:hypothetical protein
LVTKENTMKKTLAVLAVIAFAFATPAVATTTWAEITGLSSNARGVTATCTTGSESAPSASTAGILLRGAKGLSITVKTSSGGNMTAGGKLLAYSLNPATSTWGRVADGSLDLVVAAIPEQGFAGFTVTADVGSVAWVPDSVGTAVTVYHYAATK